MATIRIDGNKKGAVLVLWKIEETEDELIKMLPPTSDVTEEIEGMKFQKRRLETIASRVAVQQAVFEFGEAYHGVRKDEFGKPHLIDSNLHISISHCYPVVAGLVHQAYPVGVDLERRTDKIRRIQQKFLSEQELLDANGDIDKLTLLWCIKEALYKAFGRKQLIFKEHLEITPFELLENGTCTGLVKNGSHLQQYDLEYFHFEDQVVAYTL